MAIQMTTEQLKQWNDSACVGRSLLKIAKTKGISISPEGFCARFGIELNDDRYFAALDFLGLSLERKTKDYSEVSNAFNVDRNCALVFSDVDLSSGSNNELHHCSVLARIDNDGFSMWTPLQSGGDTEMDFSKDDWVGKQCSAAILRSRMRKINLKDVEEQTRQSPKGKFGRSSKNISFALGRDPDSLDLMKRHPFDLALVSIPKGKSLCPYHSHSNESELYLVVSGKGRVRDKDGWTDVTAGDAFFFGPGEAHQLSNAGEEDFVYYVIADNPRSGGRNGDFFFYPRSGKWGVGQEGFKEGIVKGKETDYFDGEE